MTDIRMNPNGLYGAPYDAPTSRPAAYREPVYGDPVAYPAPQDRPQDDWAGATGAPVIDGTVSDSYRVEPSVPTPAPGWATAQQTGWAETETTTHPTRRTGTGGWNTTPWSTAPGTPPSQPGGYGGTPPYPSPPTPPNGFSATPPTGIPVTPPNGFPVAPPNGMPGYQRPAPYQNGQDQNWQTGAYQQPGRAYGQPSPGPYATGQYPAQAGPATQTMTPPPFPAVQTPPPFPAAQEPTLFRTLREREAAKAAGVPTWMPATATATATTTPTQMTRMPAAAMQPHAGTVPARREQSRRQQTAVSETAQVAADEDERLLNAIGRIVSFVMNDSLFPRIVFIVLGYTAIGPLSLAYIEAVPLPIGATFVLLPAVLTMILLGMRYPVWGKRALIGWVAGMVATFVYDIARLAAVELGVFGDPIPGIGDLLLQREDVPWIVGYGWRFMGNGGGMAIAFTMLPWRGFRSGLIYGSLIVSGLIAVLYFFPVAQAHFFPLTPLTAAVGILGHWIYGAVLGVIVKKYLPPARVSLREHARLQAARAAR